MTRENAILCLKGIKNYGRDTFTEQSDWQESLDMAIKALEQEPILDKLDEIITDALDKSTDQKESQTLRWVLDKISEVEDGKIDADRLKEVFSRNVVGGNAYFDLIDNAPTVEAIVIPDNATNGDVMVVVYGIVDIEINENSVRLFPKDGGQLWVTREWWDSPHKMKSEDNENE